MFFNCVFRASLGYWLSPAVHPTAISPVLKAPSSKKKKTAKMNGKSGGQCLFIDCVLVGSTVPGICPGTRASHIVVAGTSASFPVDFFEHSSALTDIEFGGNDLLQIYNVPQIKMRLNTQGECDPKTFRHRALLHWRSLTRGE